MGAEDDSEVVQPRDALRTGIVATASNPLTILTWGAVFSGAAVADVAAGPQTAAVFVVGIGLGSLGFHLALSGLASAVGGRLGETALRWTDIISGAGLMGFGVLLGVRTVQDS
jgi:putative LysE/RhtB family amino acid efflux pump